MVIKVIEKYQMIEYLVDHIADREIFKELGEPILFDEGDIFFVKKAGTYIVGFAAINPKKDHCFLKYMYVNPDKRGNGIFNELYSAIEDHSKKTECGSIKAIATNAGLPLYQKKGFQIDKSYTNYHKISKQI